MSIDDPEKPPVVSVVVATHNRLQQLRTLLGSLAKCDPQPDEVVIVDDGSESPVSLSQEFALPCQLLRNQRTAGPGGARNRGVHASLGDIILFTDDDCQVTSEWVGAMRRALLAGRSGGLGGVGGVVTTTGADVYSRYYDFHKILQPRPHDAAHPHRLPYLVTANCGVWRHAFMRAGGFDARIPSAGGEDAAFSMRMMSRNYHFEFVADAVVYHRFRPGLRDLVKTFYRYGLGGRYVVDRYLSGGR